MPQLGQMRDRSRHARRGVDQDPRNAFDIAIDEHQRPARRMTADTLFVQARRGEDKSLHLADEAADQQLLTRGILVRIAEEDASPAWSARSCAALISGGKNGFATSETMSATLPWRPVESARATWFGT